MVYPYWCTHQHSYKEITSLCFHPQNPTHMLSFQAGHYVELLDDALPLSIANRPHPSGQLTFYVRNTQEQPRMQQFLHKLQTQPRVLLRGPLGKSLLPSELVSPCLFLAGGTGLAPIQALLEEAFHRQSTVPLRLYWGIRQPEDLYARDQLILWKKQHPHFDFTVVLSNPKEYPQWQGATGLVHEYLAKEYPSFASYRVFASGPYPMVQRAYTLFTAQGLSPHHFLSDMLRAPLSTK